MDKDKLEQMLREYAEEHQSCVTQAQELTQQVNTLTIKASRIEGSAEAIQKILEEMGEE